VVTWNRLSYSVRSEPSLPCARCSRPRTQHDTGGMGRFGQCFAYCRKDQRVGKVSLHAEGCGGLDHIYILAANMSRSNSLILVRRGDFSVSLFFLPLVTTTTYLYVFILLLIKPMLPCRYNQKPIVRQASTL